MSIRLERVWVRVRVRKQDMVRVMLSVSVRVRLRLRPQVRLGHSPSRLLGAASEGLRTLRVKVV